MGFRQVVHKKRLPIALGLIGVVAAIPLSFSFLNHKGTGEPREVTLGITDGAFTEVVSGPLKQSDPLIIADTSQEVGPSSAGTSPLRFGSPRRSR